MNFVSLLGIDRFDDAKEFSKILNNDQVQEYVFGCKITCIPIIDETINKEQYVHVSSELPYDIYIYKHVSNNYRFIEGNIFVSSPIPSKGLSGKSYRHYEENIKIIGWYYNGTYYNDITPPSLTIDQFSKRIKALIHSMDFPMETIFDLLYYLYGPNGYDIYLPNNFYQIIVSLHEYAINHHKNPEIHTLNAKCDDIIFPIHRFKLNEFHFDSTCIFDSEIELVNNSFNNIESTPDLTNLSTYIDIFTAINSFKTIESSQIDHIILTAQGMYDIEDYINVVHDKIATAKAQLTPQEWERQQPEILFWKDNEIHSIHRKGLIILLGLTVDNRNDCIEIASNMGFEISPSEFNIKTIDTSPAHNIHSMHRDRIPIVPPPLDSYLPTSYKSVPQCTPLNNNNLIKRKIDILTHTNVSFNTSVFRSLPSYKKTSDIELGIIKQLDPNYQDEGFDRFIRFTVIPHFLKNTDGVLINLLSDGEISLGTFFNKLYDTHKPDVIIMIEKLKTLRSFLIESH